MTNDDVMQTFLFYDIETTGLNKTFDQIIQFACIRTDKHLNELARHELNIKLNPDIIPSPHAMLTHRVSLNKISQGISEFDAIKQIHTWFNQPETISLGYNTLGFDDEFLRFSFYRNLLSPYHHQFKNQCGRMDIYPITLLFLLFKNHALKWPTIDNKISLKLADLKKINHLAEGTAHDAMVDAEATLALARCFFKERHMWDYLIGFFKKEIEEARLKPLENNIALMCDPRLRDEHFRCLVLFLGKHQFYKNQWLFLRLDTENFMLTSKENFRTNLFVITKKLGEPNFILPLKERFLMDIPSVRLKLATDHQQWLISHPELYTEIVKYYTTYQYPVFLNTDIEASLYLNGFLTDAEEQFCHEFHASSIEEKIQLTTECPYSKLRDLALRILGRHFYEKVTPHLAEKFQTHMQKVTADGALIDFQGKPRLTPQKAKLEIATLRANLTLDVEQLTLLNELEHYLQQNF